MNAYAAAPTSAYKESAVLTAPPERLVLMLYDGIHRFLFQATVAMRDGNPLLTNNKLQRAEAIIDELIATLDHSAGDIADRLNAIYLYSRRTLGEARIEQEPGEDRAVQGISGSSATPGPRSAAASRGLTEPYQRLVTLAELEHELALQGDFDGLERLDAERRLIVASLPEKPPAAAKPALVEMAQLQAATTAVLQDARSGRGELGAHDRREQTARGYGAPRHAARGTFTAAA